MVHGDISSNSNTSYKTRELIYIYIFFLTKLTFKLNGVGHHYLQYIIALFVYIWSHVKADNVNKSSTE